MKYLFSLVSILLSTLFINTASAKSMEATLPYQPPMATSVTGWSYQVADLVKNHDWNGLLNLTRFWTEEDPDNPLAWSLRGISNYALKQPVQAIDAYRKALHLKPDDAESWNNLGNAYDQLEQLDMGIQSYQEAIRIKPDFIEAWYNLGINYQIQGQREKAKEVYTVLYKLDRGIAERFSDQIDHQKR
jgi:tetratricopeptide (TPR) repeat protein